MVLPVVVSISGLSEVGKKLGSLRHLLDGITLSPLDWASFEMVVMCKQRLLMPTTYCLRLSHPYLLCLVLQSLTIYSSGGTGKRCVSCLSSVAYNNITQGYTHTHKAFSFICCYHAFTHMLQTVPQTWLVKTQAHSAVCMLFIITANQSLHHFHYFVPHFFHISIS